MQAVTGMQDARQERKMRALQLLALQRQMDEQEQDARGGAAVGGHRAAAHRDRAGAEHGLGRDGHPHRRRRSLEPGACGVRQRGIPEPDAADSTR
jgi:hypothetical protein